LPAIRVADWNWRTKTESLIQMIRKFTEKRLLDLWATGMMSSMAVRQHI
jgi:hypothetical protein